MTGGSLNVTVVGPTGDGFLTLFPADRNNAILLLSADPQQAFTVVAGMADIGSAHLIVNVNGWFE